MKKNKRYKNVVPLSNPLAQYDPEQPSFIPEAFRKTYKRSVYFPKRKAYVLYQVSQMVKEAEKAGIKMSFNDVAIEALELWYENNKRRHIAWILYRLRGERDSLSHMLNNFERMSKKQAEADQLSNRLERINEAINQIGKFLYENQPTITTRDYEMLLMEIIQSLKKHFSFEMSRALSKILSRSDIQELAAQVRHKHKIKKQKSVFSKGKYEEKDLYE